MLLALRLRLRIWTSALRAVWMWRAAGLVVAVGLEALGRLSPNELVDALGVLGLFLGAAFYLRSDVSAWRARGRAVAERCGRAFAPLRMLCGLDLRGTPALARRMPWRWLLPLVLALVLPVAAFLARGAFPYGAREALRSASGLLYLGYLALLWSALAAGTLAAWAILTWFLGALLSERSAGPIRGGLFLATGIGAILLPPRVPLLIVVGACALQAIAHLQAPPIPIAWRYKSESASLHRGNAALWQVGMTAGVFGVLITIALLALGAELDGEAAPETALSSLFGRFFAATLASTASVLFGHEAWQLLRARRLDPARAVPARVVLEGDVRAEERRSAKEALASAGFAVASRQRPGEVAVRVTLADPAFASPVPDGLGPTLPRARWSLVTTAQGLAEPALLARLARRDVVQRRRALVRGLQRVLKSAAGRRFARGTGFWIGCNRWFITHLSRDTDERPISSLGIPFRRAIPLAARSHWTRVLADLEIDLVFLEDGVGFRGLRRVVAAVFEYHDLFGKRRLADERHFLGLPGVRVLIHDFELERPLVRTGYPEPDYEELGRARILHVFRDRGQGFEPRHVPRRGGRRPVLVG